MSDRLDVVVIGAGAAGLAATQSLVKAGRSVKVLEAQDRVGGRVHSVQLEDGHIYERGGQFFSRHMHELLGLAKRYGFHHRVIRATPGGLAMIDGQVVPSEIEFLKRHLYPALETAPPDAADSILGWIDSLGLSPVERAMAISGAEEIWSGPLEDISFRTARRQFTDEPQDDQTLEFAMVEGNGAVLSAVAAELAPHVHLSMPALWVDRDVGGFVVGTSTKQFLARQLVVAVPPKVLDRIDWRAERDHWIGAQSDLYSGGMMIKVALRYNRPFWLDRGLGLIGQFTDPPGISVMDSSDAAGGFDTLTVFIGGSTARLWSPLPQAERWSLMMGHLEAMLGLEVRNPVTVMEADWTGHTWCGGAYNSCPRPWTDADPIRRLQDAQDGLTFAGAEVATSYSGYIEGALRSGRAAAARALGRDVAM